MAENSQKFTNAGSGEAFFPGHNIPNHSYDSGL
jgi:hypothetical protein